MSRIVCQSAPAAGSRCVALWGGAIALALAALGCESSEPAAGGSDAGHEAADAARPQDAAPVDAASATDAGTCTEATRGTFVDDACTTPARGTDDDASTGEVACDEYAARADALLRSHQGCQRDDECTISGDAVVPCFQLCFAAVNLDTDVPAFREEARALSSAYLEQCTDQGYGCAIADCADPSRFHAVCAAGRCEVAADP